VRRNNEMAKLTDYLGCSELGYLIEIGSIVGMILTSPESYNYSPYLFFASGGAYGLGRTMADIGLKREIREERREGRKELSDKV